ncbi:MAG: hypothetical protein RSA22_08445 [Acinetobacter sp.]|jgi:hypothetical protein
MRLSLSTKTIVVTLLVCVSSTNTNARRLYKWVDGSRITNYSEFQPLEKTKQKLQVLESRGEHVDPAMAVTKEMRAIEIPVEAQNLERTNPELVSKNLRTTKTVFRQGDLFELDANGVLDDVSGKLSAEERLEVQKAAHTMPVEKKELAPTTKIQAIEKTPPVVEKVVKHHPVVVEEKKPEVVVTPAKNVKPTVNPWTRTPNFVPSNLISTPPVKTSN